jgi:phthiocerol/phenolphthiocerol synthesis type-I polyketide synthase D
VACLLSDKSAERVRDRARQLWAWLDGRPSGEPPLRSLARTLDRQRGRGPHRAVVIARDRAELAAGLGALGAGEPHPGVVAGTEGQAGPGVAFVFSGYGSQWAGMGRTLAAAEPVFAEALAEVHARLSEAAGLSFAETAGDGEALRRVQQAQPALFAIQVALARLWEACGVQPDAVIGHSMGEVAAAVVSGALSVADGARVIACRSRLLSRLAGAGAMAQVGLPADEVSELAADLPDVHLAVLSSPAATVVTGDAAQVAGLVDRARASGATARVLAAEGAGHSPQVDPLLGELTEQLADITAGPAGTRCYSTVHDDPRTPPRCDAAYWAANLRRPVRLGPAVAAAARDGLRTFVEISPHPLLARPLAETVRHETGEPGVITGTLRRGTDEVLAFHAGLATLLANGASLPRPGPGLVIDLPPAPWRHETYWPDPPPPPGPPGHPLLGPHVELPTGGHAWQLRADRATWGWLPETALFPLSAAAEMTIAAACEAWTATGSAVQVSDLRLARLRPIAVGAVLTTTLDPLDPDEAGYRRAAVRIHAQDAAGAWQLLATATASTAADPPGTPPDAGGDMGRPDSPARALGLEGGPDPDAAGIRGVRRARGQHIPAEVLDRCLAAVCADGGDIPMAIGMLRVRGDAAGGGQCRLSNVRRGDGQVTVDLRLTADPPGTGPLLIEALDVRVSHVPRTAIPVPYRDKLVELSWQQQDLRVGPAVDVPIGGSEAAHRYIHEPRWVLVDEEGGLAGELTARLLSAGHQADMRCGYRAEAGAGGESRDGAAPTGVVLVAPRPPLDHQASERFVLTAIRLAASVAAQPGPSARLWIVTAGSTAVRPGEGGDPGLAAVRGLVRVLALERPGLRATLVDLDPAASQEAAAASLAAELIADEPDDEISWRDGSRLVARLVRGEAGRRTSRPAVRPGGGYIVTGGCGGLGLVVARWLAERGAGRIVLNGRSGATPQIRQVIEQLRATGAKVRVVRGDIARPGVAEKLVAAARAGGTPLRGIVHAAGVSADALLGDVTPDDLSRVWSPKVTGAWRLHEAIENHGAGPDWFLLFSSAAALVGSPGQGAYATANAWLDAFAAWRQARGLPATAINWGVWAAAGQASDVAIGGIEPIGPDEGVEALEALLTEGRATAGVIRMDPAAAAEAFPEIATRPFFASLLASGPGHGRGDQAGADAGSGSGSGGWPGAEAVRADPGRHRALIEERALTQVAAVLGLAPDRLPADLALTDAGLDSLAAQRIGYLLELHLAVTIDPAVLLGGGTLAQLRHALAAELGLEPAAAAATEPDTAPPTGEDGRPLALRDGSSYGVEPRDAAERQVARVAAQVLGVAAVGVTDNLLAVGLTEAARAEIAGRLGREAGCDLDAAALFAIPTVEAAADLVRQAEDGEVSGLIRTIQAGSGALPVLLAHPAGGTTGVYKALAGLLGRDRPVFGLERLDGEVSARCRRYAGVIPERFPGGCVLGGWSFGGVLGYETARQLAAAGYRVRLVVLLDAALPRPVPPGDEGRWLARRFVAFADYLTRTYGREVRLSDGELLGRPEEEQLGLVLGRISEAGLDDQLSPAILRHQRTSYEDTRALERYQAGGYEGPVVLYRAERETPWTVRDPRYDITGEARGWDRLCQRLEVAGVDAHHLNLLDPPAVTVVGAHLRELLSRIGDEP